MDFTKEQENQEKEGDLKDSNFESSPGGHQEGKMWISALILNF